jgi:hypothetical protein
MAEKCVGLHEKCLIVFLPDTKFGMCQEISEILPDVKITKIRSVFHDLLLHEDGRVNGQKRRHDKANGRIFAIFSFERSCEVNKGRKQWI